MGSREFKNVLPLRDKSYGLERRQNLTKEELSNSSPFPKPITYEDIDKEFKKWVDEKIKIVYEGKRIPTYSLFSNQRFSEYLQSWEHVDDKKNPILNFKTVTRESNPQPGTINGDSKNIPGERTYLMQRVEARDKNDRKYYIDYRMKQPMGVDFRYSVSIMTNRYELVNEFNQLMNNEFKAITAYLRVNGHFISMKLENISDESQYNIDDRQFYSQSCSILVKGYIITKEDFIVKEIPVFKFMDFEVDRRNTFADIEELPCPTPENHYYYKPLLLKVGLSTCDEKIKFVMDCNFTVERLEFINSVSFVFRVNDEITELKEGLLIPEGAEVKFSKVRRKNYDDCVIYNIYGVEKDVVYDDRKNNEELDINQKQINEVVEISYDDNDCFNNQ